MLLSEFPLEKLWLKGEDKSAHSKEDFFLEKDRPFRGGETKALERMNHYLGKEELIHQYKDKRNGFIGLDYSSKFSPWLALGCISPRTIVRKIKSLNKQSEGSEWLIVELMWRDWFR